MTQHLRLALAATVCLATLAGCTWRDPYRRDDVWYPTGVNATNLAAQVANPNDLVRGRDDSRQWSGVQIKAVNRIWTDNPKNLLQPGSSGGSTSGGSGSSSGGGGGGDNPGASGPSGGGS